MGTTAPPAPVPTTEVPAPVQDAPAPLATDIPAPVQEAEAKVEEAAPAFAKPAVGVAEAEFDAVVAQDAAKGKDAGKAIEAKNPDLTVAIQDFEKGDLAGVLKEAPAVVKEVKAGYRSTEFWLTLIGVVLTQLGALKLPGKYGDTITTSALVGTYVVSRGIAKSG